MGKTRHPCHGIGEGSTSLSCGVVCHQAWNDVWVVSPVAERRAPLAWPESPASGSPQSAPAEACRHGPAGVESAVARSPYRSALGRHSLSEFLVIGLNDRRDGSQPSIFVRSFSPITNSSCGSHTAWRSTTEREERRKDGVCHATCAHPGCQRRPR